MPTNHSEHTLQRRHFDLGIVRALVAEFHGAGFPAGLREEQLIVIRVIRALGYRCCGQADFDLSGTNQFFIRVKCCRCLRVLLRYPRS